MIDTLRIMLSPSPLKIAGSDWIVKSGTNTDENGVRCWTSYNHKETALRIYAQEGFAVNFEVSLPRLMHSSNGILLRPSEVNTAYFAALDLASTVIDEILPLKLQRVDLVHHFKGFAFEFIDALKDLKHSNVRKKQIVYTDTGLTWPGINLLIRIYDKKMEMYGQPGYIQRLEIQLRNNKLDKMVWSPLSGFDVDNLYQIYRKFCGGFSTRSIPKVGSHDEFLYWLKLNDVRINGICVVERYLARMSRASKHRIKKALNGISLDFFDASFSRHLPDNINDLTFLDCIPDAVPTSPEAPLRGVGESAA